MQDRAEKVFGLALGDISKLIDLWKGKGLSHLTTR